MSTTGEPPLVDTAHSVIGVRAMPPRISRAATVLVAALFLLPVGAACIPSQTATRVPTREEAVGLLDDAVRLARAGDFALLCGLGSGNCEEILETAGMDAVPGQPPVLAGDYVIPPSSLPNGAVDVGGRVLVLCGTDGRARPFRTEMIVFFQNGALRAIEPIYWSGMSVGPVSRPVTATAPPFAETPMACP